MDVIKIQKNFWRIISTVVLFSMYWVLFPIMCLFKQFDIFMVILALVFGPITLYWLCSVLIDCAEPYEIDRVTRYGYILWGARPTALEACIFVLGCSIANIGSRVSKESIGSDLTTAIVILMFGVLFIILGVKWWMDTLKWRINIEKYRIPKSEWL